MLEILKEHFLYRTQILSLAKVDLCRTYKGAFLSWFWAIFKPAFAIFVYYFTFSIGLRASKDMFGYPYFLWLISGVVPWFYINDILYQGSESIRKYSYLVTKVKFPVSTIPTFCSISKFIIHLILILIVILIFAFSKPSLSIYCLQLPFYMLMMFLFFTSLSLLLASLSAISKDFFSMVKSSVFALFWLSGVIWDPAFIDNPIIKAILYFNPITYIVNGYRNCFIKKVWFFEEPISLVCFLIVFLIVLCLSIFVYKRVKKDIPDLL